MAENSEMDQATLAAVLLGAVITLATTTVSEWLRYFLTRHQQRNDRRDDFQHDSLVSLQDAASSLAEILLRFAGAKDQSNAGQLEYTVVHLRMFSLMTRINDAALQQRGQELIYANTGVIRWLRQTVPTAPEARLADTQEMAKMHQAFNQFNNRIGKLLRTS
jgi:hypothetical protein